MSALDFVARHAFAGMVAWLSIGLVFAALHLRPNWTAWVVWSLLVVLHRLRTRRTVAARGKPLGAPTQGDMPLDELAVSIPQHMRDQERDLRIYRLRLHRSTPPTDHAIATAQLSVQFYPAESFEVATLAQALGTLVASTLQSIGDPSRRQEVLNEFRKVSRLATLSTPTEGAVAE